MRDKLLTQLAHWHTAHPGRMLLIVLILTIILTMLSSNLSITMRWSDLLPEDDPRTVQFNRILDEFVSASSIVVVVQGEENRMKEFADRLVPRLLAAVDTSKNQEIAEQLTELQQELAQKQRLDENPAEINQLENKITERKERRNKKLVQRVDYKTEVDFLRRHGLMLIKEDDLKNMKEIFKNPNLKGLLANLNYSMEKEYVGREESISTREKEDNAVQFLDGLQGLVGLLQNAADGEEITKNNVQATADKLLLGEPYFLSYDKKALVLNVIPNYTIMDMDLLMPGTETIQTVVDDLLKEYPDLSAGLTGMIPVGHDEMKYSQQSLGYTSLIAMIGILLLLIFSFRMWVAPVFASINLIIGTLWAMGIVAVTVGQLNFMTQMFAVILLGLGIDFSIHLISNFTELRAKGNSISQAMLETFQKSGKGILTGGLTTAAAFLTMVVSSSRGMKEMGLVTGFGLLAILIATFLLLPSMLVLRERRLEKKGKGIAQKVQRDISFRFLGRTSARLGKKYPFTILGSLIVTLLLIWSATRITFDHNYMNIEPEGLTSITLQDTVLDKFDLSMDYALILTDDVDQSREITKAYREMGSVARTEDISLYLPSPSEQKERAPHIREIATEMQVSQVQPRVTTSEIDRMIQEIDTLRMNIIEMQTMAFLGGQDKVESKCNKIVGNPDKPEMPNRMQKLLETLEANRDKLAARLTPIQKSLAPYFKQSVLTMSNTEAIQLTDLPQTVLDRYSNKDRTQFLTTVYPAGNIWQDANFLESFVDDLEYVSQRATGMPPVFRALIEVIARDGKVAVSLTLIIVFILLWFDFRDYRYALIALIPLAFGMFWMVGLMQLTGMQFTVMNVMGLPMIIGIGIDDGVHLVHRWIAEGKNKLTLIFASTGKAILLTSLTTMLAFGSLVFSIWRGFGQLGGALFLGVGACFLTTVIVLPGIMGFLERKNERTE